MSDDRTLTKTQGAPAEDARAAVRGRLGGGDASNAPRHERLQSETGSHEVAWAWATEHRAPELASTAQLVSWLARGELPPHTLVWKPGWGEWLPAMQVAELAAAFPSVTPGSRRVARLAADHDTAPPPVPVAHYPRLRLLAKDVVGQSAQAPFSGVSPAIATAPAERRALRDLDHVQQDLVTSQVPVAAMLERARAMKRQAASGGGQPASGGQGSERPHFGTFGGPLDVSLQAESAGGSAAPSAAGPSGGPPLRTLSPLAVELGFPALLDSEASLNALRPRRYGRWLALGALAGGALGLLAIRGPSTEAAATAPARAETAVSSLAPRAPENVAGPCRASGKSVRLDEHAVPHVPVSVALLPSAVRVAEASAGVRVEAGQVAVAYAQSSETAVGLALSPDSLELTRLSARRGLRPIYSVTPIAAGAELVLHTEREGTSVAYARSVDVQPPLRIGMSSLGVVGGPLDEQAKKLWELPAGTMISVPAVAAHPGGLTIAALAGRKQGPLRVGVVSGQGEALSELGRIGDSSSRFGRPALASGAGVTALAVAERSRDGSKQAIWLARATAGEPPLVLQPFEPALAEPLGGGAAELDTPALAALPGGGFALLFTQGQGWKRRVHLQRLSATLAPLGDPIEITRPDRVSRGAAVAALAWAGDRLLAFHFEDREGQARGAFSLWVSSVECELSAPAN